MSKSAKPSECLDRQPHHTDGEAQLAFLNREHTVSVCQSCHQTLGGGD